MPTSTSTSPRDIILHRRSRVFGKRPLASDIQKGEIAVNYREDDLGLYIKDREENIRKIGGIFYSDSAPDPSIAIDGWPDLSHGELWLKKPDPLDLEGKTQLWVWNKYANGGAGDWIHVGVGTYGILDDYLDQFKDGADGDDYIHTDRNKLKINNKVALRGYATTIPSDDEFETSKAGTLVINDNHNFATGVILNANNLVISSEDIDATSDSVVFNSDSTFDFQTDSISGTAETIFTYASHGLFNGEEVFVAASLNDGSPSPVTSGNYIVTEASLNTFKLSNGTSNILSSGNIKINYSSRLLLDKEYNVIQSGNFKIKGLSEDPDISQIKDGTWDVYQNTSNGNVRVYARIGNTVSQPDAAVISFPVRNNSGETINAGDPVYFAGTDPIKRTVLVAKADAADPLKMRAIGLSQLAILPGGNGNVTIFGGVKNLDTSALDGNTNLDDSGKIVYVKPGGGLTLNQPSILEGEKQPIGVLFVDDNLTGEIFVNHPDVILTDIPSLPENYIWVGATNDVATAHRLNADSFKTFLAGDAELEISLADEIKFGGYEFLWDGQQSKSKIQNKITTSDIENSNYAPRLIDSFSTNYRSAKFFVQISSLGELNLNYQITELLIVHNNEIASIVDYGTASTQDLRMGDFYADVDMVDNLVKIYFQRYAANQGDLEIKVVRTAVLS